MVDEFVQGERLLGLSQNGGGQQEERDEEREKAGDEKHDVGNPNGLEVPWPFVRPCADKGKEIVGKGGVWCRGRDGFSLPEILFRRNIVLHNGLKLVKSKFRI